MRGKIDFGAPGGVIHVPPETEVIYQPTNLVGNRFPEERSQKEKEKRMVKRIKCEYCGQTNDEETQLKCIGCGAGLPETNCGAPLWINPAMGMVNCTSTAEPIDYMQLYEYGK